MATELEATAGRTTKEGVLYIGMDLGCYKTSVAATNGTREVVYSIVGWPKDPVSRKMLGKDIVFGNEAFQHRLALDTVRPFEKGALKFADNTDAGVPPERLAKYKEAAKELVKYVVSLCRPPKGTLVYGVIGSPARASILNKQALMDACKGTFEAVMIVSEPFAVAYGTNTLEDALIVDIGAGTTHLCRAIVPDIVAGLRKLVSSYDAEFQKRMLQNVVLAGGGSQLRGLDRLIEDDLQQYGGGKVTKVHEPVYAGANGALKLAADMPEDYWKEVK